MSIGKTIPGFSLNSFVAPKEDWYKNLNLQDSIDMAKEKMVATAENFVALGYYLKHIKDNELYKDKGYKNIWECASNELYLTQPTASRYINICEKFSKYGNSPYLDAKYKEYNKSQLQEMLAIDQNLIEQITPDMSVKEIQKLKKSNRVEKAATQTQQEHGDQIEENTYETLPGQMEMIVDGTYRELGTDTKEVSSTKTESVFGNTIMMSEDDQEKIPVTESVEEVTESAIFDERKMFRGGYDLTLIDKLITRYENLKDSMQIYEYNCLLDALALLRQKLN